MLSSTKGIQNRVDYLRQLDVKGIWISPIFTSPMVDHGYDISNYTDIDPIFGTIEDFKVCFLKKVPIMLIQIFSIESDF